MRSAMRPLYEALLPQFPYLEMLFSESPDATVGTGCLVHYTSSANTVQGT